MKFIADKIKINKYTVNFIVICLAIFCIPQYGLSSNSCSQVFGENKNSVITSRAEDKWEFGDSFVRWTEFDSRQVPQFYGVAGRNRAGVLYLNLKMVSENGKTRTANMTGKQFINKALDYFRSQGQLITGIKGWWIFRPDEKSEATLEQQIEQAPYFSVNFSGYWKNRKHENDIKAAGTTWTAKVAAENGFTEITRVSEYHKVRNYRAVYVTFLSKNLSKSEVEKSLFKDQDEIEVPILKSFRETQMGEDVTATALKSLFNLNLTTPMSIEIIEQNSQVAADFKSLGFRIVGAERRIDDGQYEIFIRVRR